MQYKIYTGTVTPKITGKAHENRRPTSVLRHRSSRPLFAGITEDFFTLFSFFLVNITLFSDTVAFIVLITRQFEMANQFPAEIEKINFVYLDVIFSTGS